MGVSTFPHSLEELEEYIDRTLRGLKMYSYPMDLALIMSMTAFEHGIQRIMPFGPQSIEDMASLLDMKSGLAILVPEILRNCPSLPPARGTIEISDDMLLHTLEALRFCQRYETAVLAYTQFHQGWFNGTLVDRVAEFKYSEGVDLGRAQLSRLLADSADSGRKDEALGIAASLPRPPTSAYEKLMDGVAPGEGAAALLRTVPDALYAPVREVTDAALAAPTVPMTADCASYTLGQFYTFWIDLVTLMNIYRYACAAYARNNKTFNPVTHLVPQISLADLAAAVSERGRTDFGVAYRIVSDLVLEPTAPRPDVLIHPLVPTSSPGVVLVAPTVVTTSSWEVCLLRNWVARYPDEYGAIIGTLKEGMADQLGGVFRRDSFRMGIRKKLADSTGRTVGDVDVAVFDPSDGLLALFEAKWLIPPDSPRETTRAHEEIWKGITQVLLSKCAFEDNASRFLEQVFPEGTVTPAKVKRVVCYVVGQGDTGLRDDHAHDVRVLDYALLRTIVGESDGEPLAGLLTRVCARQESLSRSIAGDVTTADVKLAGFLFRLPGTVSPHGREIMAASSSQEHGRNERCLCGSGKKYKRCCLPLARFNDAYISA